MTPHLWGIGGDVHIQLLGNPSLFRSPVLDADPEVIELPWSLVFVLPLVPLLLPSKLLQLAEAVREQEVRGQGWVVLLRWSGGGR